MFALPLSKDARAQTEARELFERAWPEVLEGNWALTRKEQRLLEDYPLWVDLQAARYSAEVSQGVTANAQEFLERAPDLAPTRRLRYRLVSALARTARWREFFAAYEDHYSNHSDAALACTALAAAVKGKSPWNVEQQHALGRKLWLVGRSQEDRCDPAFDALKREGVIGSAEFAERFDLAVERGNYGLASYLASTLDGDYRNAAALWKRTHNAPRDVLTQRSLNAALSPAQIEHAVRRLALRDPLAAHELWHTDKTLRARTSSEQQANVFRFLALAGAQDGLSEAKDWFRPVPASVRDERWHAWRVRAALRADDWPEVLRGVADMPIEQASTPRWRYWEAVALTRSGQLEAGRSLLGALAEDRSYHGFLAADAVDAAYRFDDERLPVDPDLKQSWSQRFEWRRVVELFHVDQVARARHELAVISRNQTKPNLIALGALAHELGWHHEAVRLAVEGGHLDDLELRFPLAHSEFVASNAEQHDLDANWVFALARNESLFDPSVKSGAGARGVMQLIPSTARRTARALGMTRIPSAEALHDPDINIALGTAHLAELKARFGHRALATAAYNAGPHRVVRWTAETDIDTQVWIETLPYDETRNYVQKVLFASIVFQWRNEQPVERLIHYLKPLPRQERVAETGRL
ncbi:MAG: transglycosylase SLT domain-containing protein [Pseudomonadota bacterium]